MNNEPLLRFRAKEKAIAALKQDAIVVGEHVQISLDVYQQFLETQEHKGHRSPRMQEAIGQ